MRTSNVDWLEIAVARLLLSLGVAWYDVYTDDVPLVEAHRQIPVQALKLREYTNLQLRSP